MAGLIRELNAQGIPAQQRYHISEATYRGARSTPARLFLRLRQYVVYPVQLVAVLGKRRVKLRGESGRDICVVSTNTFYAPLLATLFHRNVVHLVYDLFPEAMVHSGKWREGSLKVKTVRWLTRQTLRRAKLNIFLGERLERYVESIHGDCGPSAIIAVGADQALFPRSPVRRETSKAPPPSAEPTVLYCGNFGNMHDSETLFQYWEQSTTLPCRFAFHCSGPKRGALAAKLPKLTPEVQAQITLGEGLGQEAWIAVMESADLALVTMTPGAETVVMPSKTYSAMMAGQAILAIAPENSDLVDLIKAADCGWWAPPGEIAQLESTLEAIAASPEQLLQKRKNAYYYAHQHFGQNALAKDWIRALRAN